MLIGVQYLRAVAASLVVVQHVTSFVPGGKWQMVGGGFGVDLFFLISGFVIWVSGSDSRAGDFAVRRVIRIVPLYWATTIVAALFQLRNGLMPYFWPEAGDFIRSMLFIAYENPIRGGDVSPVLGVGWTLNLEMYFYAIFTAGLLIAREHVLAFVIGVLYVVPAAFMLAAPDNAILGFYAQSTTLEFAAGMVIGHLYMACKRTGGKMVAPLACLAVAAALLAFAPRAGIRAIDAGIPAALILIAVIRLEPAFRRRRSRLGMLLGDASYALYLTHALILPIFGPLVGQGLLPRNGLVTRPLAFVICAAVAVAVHLWFEKPVTRLLRRAMDGWRRKVTPHPPGKRRPVASGNPDSHAPDRPCRFGRGGKPNR